MKKYLLLFPLLAPSVAIANISLPDFEFTPEKISVSLSSGILTGGESQELVFGGNRTVSQLDWEIKSSPIVKADLSWQFLPRLSLNASGWTTLSSSKSLLNNYDYFDPENAGLITDWSNHSDTRLNYANEFDLNLNAWLINQSNYKLGTVVGYQENRFSWLAKGGRFKYSDEDENGNYLPGSAQTLEGEFAAGKPGIGYKQKFSMPYIGITGQYTYKKIELSGALKYSPWVKAKDLDNHYSNEITSVTRGKRSDYYGVMLNAGYNIIPSTTLFTEVNWNEFKKAKGTTTAYQVGELLYDDVDGGLSNKHYTVNLGVKYNF